MQPSHPTAPIPDDLALMPRSVRDKLDRVGLKVHLREWELLSLSHRQRLCDLPCQTEAEIQRFAAEVERLVRAVTGKPADRLTPA